MSPSETGTGIELPALGCETYEAELPEIDVPGRIEERYLRRLERTPNMPFQRLDGVVTTMGAVAREVRKALADGTLDQHPDGSAWAKAIEGME